jgi:hypothetical protein
VSTHQKYGDRQETQNIIVFDVPTIEELIRNLKVTELNMSRGSGTSEKIS